MNFAALIRHVTYLVSAKTNRMFASLLTWPEKQDENTINPSSEKPKKNKNGNELVLKKFFFLTVWEGFLRQLNLELHPLLFSQFLLTATGCNASLS